MIKLLNQTEVLHVQKQMSEKGCWSKPFDEAEIKDGETATKNSLLDHHDI